MERYPLDLIGVLRHSEAVTFFLTHGFLENVGDDKPPNWVSLPNQIATEVRFMLFPWV